MPTTYQEVTRWLILVRGAMCDKFEYMCDKFEYVCPQLFETEQDAIAFRDRHMECGDYGFDDTMIVSFKFLNPM